MRVWCSGNTSASQAEDRRFKSAHPLRKFFKVFAEVAQWQSNRFVSDGLEVRILSSAHLLRD